MKLILKRGMFLIVTGIAIGSLASIALARVLASQVRGVSGTDGTPLALVVILVALAGLAACLLPSLRVEPWPSAMNRPQKNLPATKLFPIYSRLYLWEVHRFLWRPHRSMLFFCGHPTGAYWYARFQA